MINLCHKDAEEVFLKTAGRIEQIADLLTDLEATLEFNSDNYRWESFTPQQRALMAHWHVGCKNAQIALRKQNG